MAISEELFRRAATAAYDMHRHRDWATWPACVAAALAHAVGCDSAALVSVDLERRDFHLDTWPAAHFGHVDHAEVARLHALEHPFVERCASSRAIGAFRLSDLAPRERFLQTALYRSLYRFLGIEHQLIMLLASADARWRAVVLNRSAQITEEAPALETPGRT